MFRGCSWPLSHGETGELKGSFPVGGSEEKLDEVLGELTVDVIYLFLLFCRGINRVESEGHSPWVPMARETHDCASCSASCLEEVLAASHTFLLLHRRRNREEDETASCSASVLEEVLELSALYCKQCKAITSGLSP